MRKSPFLFFVIAAILWVMPAFAELRPVHRASEIGGSGLLFQRFGDQLDAHEMNASIFGEYLQFGKMPLNPTRVSDEPYVDDPRGDQETWATITYNYGLSDIVEMGIQVPMVFNSDLRENGVGRIGCDLRVLLLNVDRAGTGISTTFWINFPSPQRDNSSDLVNGGGELNFTLKGTAFTNYWLLEPMRLHFTMGYGYEDYLEFKKNDHPDPDRAEGYRYRDLDSPQLVGTQVMYASLALEFEVYDRTFIGSELLFRQYPDPYHNDNNTIVVAPEISYTYKDRLTLQAAFGFTGIEHQSRYDSQPVFLGKIGFTYHFPEFNKPPKAERETPARPQDIYQMFSPSRKPVPTQAPEQEVPLPENQ
jgi:hypothetical protein